MNIGEKMTETKKRLQLKPLKVGEIISLPCYSIITVKEIWNDLLFATVEGYGLKNHKKQRIPSIEIGILKESIPFLIKTLRRAQKTK